MSVWQHHVIGVVSTNCYILGKPEAAIMVDPGGVEAVGLAQQLQEEGITIKHVLVSHGHFDHLGWAAEVQKVVEGARVFLHKDEKAVYEEFLEWIPRMGLPAVELREPDVWITDQQILKLDGLEFRVLHTPGHSPGSATFQLLNGTGTGKLQEHSAFVGDCLFEGSIGRIDLPYSDKDQMVSSLKLLMQELDNTTAILPGHGNTTNMLREKENNPYLMAIQRGISFF